MPVTSLSRPAVSLPDSLFQRPQREAHTFEENLAAELGLARFTLAEDYRELAEAGSGAVQVKFHFHQEGVAFGADLIKIDFS